MVMENMIVDTVNRLQVSGLGKYFDMMNELDGAISLGVGEPDFATPKRISNRGIDTLQNGHTQYSSSAGFIELREEISKYMKTKYALDYNPANQVIVTVGGSEGIDIALRALLGPGDEVIIPEPSFVAYKGCAELTGGTVRALALRAEDEFKLTPELLKSAINEKTKVLLLPFPNNPTGATMTRDELAKIVDILKDKNIVVISDEIYSELRYDEKHASIAGFPEMTSRTLIINGFSKSFAMTGWRLGYACGPVPLIQAMMKIHQYAMMCAPTTAQYAAIEALRHCDDEVQSMAEAYNSRRIYVIDRLRRMGLDCFEAMGALYVFPSIQSTGLQAGDFCEQLLLRERVLVVPGDAFGDCGEGFIRICYASSMKNLVEAMDRIERFVLSL